VGEPEEGQLTDAREIPRMRTEHRTARVQLIVLLLVLGTAPLAQAYDYFIAPINEIPLTSRAVVGARAMGMGGVAFAVSDDASAMTTNPAGLARLRRVELSGGLSKKKRDLTGSTFGSDFDTSVSSTRLSSMRFAYPFPTFRGSLVLGLSVDQMYDFADDFLAIYSDSYEGTDGNIVDQAEGYLQDGAIYSWTLSGAFDASENVSLGVSVAWWTGDYRQGFQWEADTDDLPPDYYGETAYGFRTDSSVSGFQAKFGTLFYASDKIALGFVLDTPVGLTFNGYREDYGTYEDESQWYEGRYFRDKITIPFGFGGGIALYPTDLIVIGADVYYTDWSEMRYEWPDNLLDPTSRRLPYEATTDVRVGAEFTVPSWPLRLRGGYMTSPLAYQGLEIDQDRSYFTVGAGVLIDTVLTIDFAYLWGGFERSGDGYDYSEKSDETAFLLEAAYRF